MKTFKVKPAEKFALEFEDGKKIEMCFNTKSLSYLAEQINGKKMTFVGPEFFASIIYAGARAVNSDFTIEEANALYIILEEAYPEALNGIINEYYDASGVDKEAVKKNLIQSLI